MLTKVILEGPMGRAFGREWNLAVSCPRKALEIIEANKPGLRAWIRKNLDLYSHYRVTCKYRNGTFFALDKEEYELNADIAEIRYEPIVQGAGAVGKIIAGVVLIVIGAVLDYFSYGTAGNWAVGMGIGLLAGGIVEALSPRPKNDDKQNRNLTSNYFDGPTNTEMQGIPVPLIYGPRVMVGSHPISVGITIDNVTDLDA